MGNLKNLKQSLAKGGGGNAWIKFIPKNGSMNVRFIQEPEEWVNYVEHFDTTIRRSYPCNGTQTCPGCLSEERKSNRYLANAVDVDTDRVIPLQMPKDLANRLVARYERNGTLTDRDFELSRSGEGLDTIYDLDAGSQDRKNIAKYTPLDLLKVLDDSYNDVFGNRATAEDDDDDIKPPTTVTRTRARSKAAAQVDEDEGVEEAEAMAETDPEPEPEKPVKKAAKKAAAKKVAAAPEPEFTPDVDTDDDDGAGDEPEAIEADTDADDDAGEDDEQTWDEASLKALPLGALRAVARDFDVDVKGKDADSIIAEIMAGGEPA
jgi:hypothetical protein